MERSDAICLFEDSKNRIKWFLRDIDEDINGSNRLVFKGTVSVQLYDIAENVGKVVNYIRDGKRDADRLKSELLNLRIMVKELQSKSLQKGYEPFAYKCGMTIGIIDNMEKWETSHIENNPIPETGGNEDVGNGEKTKADNKPKTKDDIIKSLEGKEQFVPSKPINLYDVFYDRLVKGKIKNKNDEYHVLGVLRKICDDDKENVELFKRCVESADISNLYNEGKKSYARLFMNDIASLFSEPEKFRKAAAKSFGLKEGTELGAVGGNYKKDYRSLMNGLFDDNADYRNRNNS